MVILYKHNFDKLKSTDLPISKKIFALRKQNNLSEAYELVCSIITGLNEGDTISDVWTIRACCYTITDLINEKLKIIPVPVDICNELCSELDYFRTDLCIEQTDQVLQKKIDYCRNKCNSFNKPGADLLIKAMSIPKKERNAEAIELLSKYISVTGDTSQLTNLGWRIYFHLAELSAPKTKDVDAIKKAFHTYIIYGINNKTDNILLKKLILNEGIKLNKYLSEKQCTHKFDFPAFVKLWNLSNVTDEFWIKEDNVDRDYPIFAEVLYSTLAKRLADPWYKNIEYVEYFLPHVKNAITRLPDNIWMNLYLAKIYCKIGKSNEAYDYAFKILKEKRNDSWSWHLMANVYGLCGDEDMQISCLAKALLCHDQEMMKVTIHKELAKLLQQRELYADARFEYDRYFVLKQNIPMEDRDISSEQWYISAPLLDDHYEFYKDQSLAANGILIKSLPSIYAILGPENSYIDPKTGKHKSKRILHVLDRNDANNSGEVKYANQFIASRNDADFSQFSVGTLLELKGEIQDRKISVMSVIEISDHEFIKVMNQSGMITGIDNKNNNAFITFNGSISVRLSPEELKKYGIISKIGTVIKGKLSARINKQGKRIFELMSFCSLGSFEDLPSGFIKEFNGEIRRYKESNHFDFDSCFDDEEDYASINEKKYWAYGFVDNVFIPPHLAKIFKHNQKITGKAVKTDKGYQAISATLSHDGQFEALFAENLI